MNGAIELTADRGSNIYQENGAFVIPPYTPRCINAKSCYTLLSLCISKDIAANAEYEKTKSDIREFLRDALNQPVIEHKMIRALHSLFTISQMMPARKETALDGLKRQLETRPERRYSIDDMSRFVFASKYHMIRSFKQETGLTPLKYFDVYRVAKSGSGTYFVVITVVIITFSVIAARKIWREKEIADDIFLLLSVLSLKRPQL